MAIASSGNTQYAAPGAQTNSGALVVVTALFFMWGFCTVLNDALIPHLQTIFTLNYVQAALIQLAFFGSYFLFAWPAGKLIESIGYQKTMVVGLITMTVGALLFLPAASTAIYAYFLGAQVVLAAGVTLLQVAANPYVTILGPPESASSRLNLTQAFNTLGDTVAPYFGSVLILGGAAVESIPTEPAAALSYRIQQASSVKLPYLIIAGILIVLALAIALFKFPRIETTQDFRPGANDVTRESIWSHPHVWLGALAIFIYVGAEVSAGSFMAKFIAQKDIGNVSLQTATKLVMFYWAGMALGRFVGSGLMKRVAPNKVLVVVGFGAMAVIALALFSTGTTAMIAILSVGLFNSIMFPTIFTLGVAEMGPLTGRASGLLVQAIVGGAAVPVIMGHMADNYGIHRALVVPLLCYLFIIYYGIAGYRIKPGETQSHLEATAA